MSNVKGVTVKPSQSLNLDVNQQKKFIRFFTGLGEKPSTTVRLFERTDYYSVHGEDAHLAAKIIFKSTATVKTMAPGEVAEIDYISLSKGNFEILLRELLLVKNYRVEVFTTKSGNSDWEVQYKGSPGNLIQFENLLFNNTEMVVSSSLLAVNMKQTGQRKTIGVACIEQNERTFSVTEFEDDDFFAELEATVVLLSPKEAILPSVDGEFAKIKTVLERNNVMITMRKRNEFAIEKIDLDQDLKNLLHFEKGQQENANAIPEMAKTLAMSALGAAIKYLDLISDTCNMGHFKIVPLNLDRFVHLDAAAVSALNLLPKPGTALDSPAYKWQSILGVLDRCQTPQGHRLMAQWIKQPLRNENLIKDRHNIVQCFVEASTARTELYDEHLKRMPDILMLGKKLMRKRATLQDIHRLYQVVLRIPKILLTLKELDCSTVTSVICEPIADILSELVMFRQMVEQIIDVDAIEKGEYLIKASFDDSLKEMKSGMDTAELAMRKELSKTANDLELDSVKLDYVSQHGHHFRIALRDDECLRRNNKYRILDAIKGGVRFTSDKLSALNDDFMRFKEEYEEQQKSIVDEVIRVALGYLGSFTRLNNYVAQLDCLLSFAIAAASAPATYIKPKMVSEEPRVLTLRGLRHPCLELQDDVTYIANDITFQNDETNMYIITGPNMGGKSTYIRSVGAAVLMAHVGAFVPCDEAIISYVDSILGRIGADDNINKGLSTFMVEMIETAGIIRTATKKSLVVIDELGRGTSTYEGCGIAWAIAEHLAKETKCFTLFATHFHEITDLANTLATVKNSHMMALSDNDEFTLLYQVKPGVMDKSFGIHVAKLANFPEHVVQMAQKIYDESDDHYLQMKMQDDHEAAQIFVDAIEQLCTPETSSASEAELQRLVNDIRQRVKSSNSPYFRNAFPQLFK